MLCLEKKQEYFANIVSEKLNYRKENFNELKKTAIVMKLNNLLFYRKSLNNLKHAFIISPIENTEY